MIILGSREIAPEHTQLNMLIDFLEKEYSIPSATITLWYDYSNEYFLNNSKPVTGLVNVRNNNAAVRVITRNRPLRAIALTTAHEYMHCIQFIVRDLTMTKQNSKKLEDEAITFAEDVLKRLWIEQKIFYPSS